MSPPGLRTSGSISDQIREPPLNTVELRVRGEVGNFCSNFHRCFIGVHREFIGEEFQSEEYQRVYRVNPMKL